MQHLQTFADNTEKDKDVPHHQTTSFFGPLTKAGKEDGSLGGDGAKEVSKMAKEIIAKQLAEEDADDDDSDVEMIIEGLTPMSDAGIMEYRTHRTLESPGNFIGDSSSTSSPRSRATSTTRTSRTRRTTRRRTRRRTRRTRMTTSPTDLVELSSQRRGQPPSWRVQPAGPVASKRYSRTPG